MNIRTHTVLSLLGALAAGAALAACDSAAPVESAAGSAARPVQDVSTAAGLTGEHRAVGSGYADFVLDDGSEGENRYFSNARVAPDGTTQGGWRADVYIDFGGFIFDFEVLYTVDCLEVDPVTREAWVEGTVFEANDPEFLGQRAFLYIQDGGPGGDDYHAITPLEDAGVTCADRPEPDFRELVERGSYVVE